MQFAPLSRLVSRHRELPDSSGFRSRMCAKRWRLIHRSEYISMSDFPKNKLSPHRQALYEAADAQRKLCRDWLLYIMSASSERTRTKDDLRAEATERFRVSKSAFDVAWTWA